MPARAGASVIALSGKLLAVRRWLIVMACGLVVTVALALRFFVFPSSEPLGRSDAVILLAGNPETRLPMALRLAEDGPGVLVVSAAGGEVNAPARALCDAPSDLTVHCLQPATPEGTRGEARAVADLVNRYGWTRVTVVTNSYHVQRAGLLLRRCTAAEVQMAVARPAMSLVPWTLVILHETAGLVEAAVDRDC